MRKNRIAELIPHAGRMVLLEDVVRWDEQSILCSTTTHLDPQNPLRREGILHSVVGSEYGAQAIAVHGGLLGFNTNGYLGSLRNISLHTLRLDEFAEPLEVEASLQFRSDGNQVYEFKICTGGRDVISGRVAIFSLSVESL